MRRTTGEKIFNICNLIFLVIFIGIILVPVLYVIKVSLETGPKGFHNISLIPSRPSLVFYKMIIQKQNVTTSFMNSIRLTLIGTILSVALEAVGAYTISNRQLPGRGALTYMLIIPMMFSGGMIPSYLVVRYLGLMNTFWAMIIPTCISGWNVILIRNYYWSVPDSLRESARIDGAQEFTIFIRIILPLAMPVIAAIGMFTIVGYWNTYFSALLYIHDPRKYPFQLVLRELILLISNMENQMQQAGLTQDQLMNVDSQAVSSAMIIVSIIPIMIIYPFLQKYFVKGIMIGSIKG